MSILSGNNLVTFTSSFSSSKEYQYRTLVFCKFPKPLIQRSAPLFCEGHPVNTVYCRVSVATLPRAAGYTKHWATWTNRCWLCSIQLSFLPIQAPEYCGSEASYFCFALCKLLNHRNCTHRKRLLLSSWLYNTVTWNNFFLILGENRLRQTNVLRNTI